MFGDPRYVTRATLAAVFDTPTVRENDINGLAKLSGALHCAVSVLQCSDYTADLAASSNLSTVVAKLPRSVAWRWGEHTVRMRPAAPTLIDLDSWLRDYVDAGRACQQSADLPTTADTTRSTERNPPRKSRHSVLTAGREKCSGPASSCSPCVCCEQPHCVPLCSKFKALSVQARAKIAVKHNLCFNCLTPDHRSRECGSTEQCASDGCKKKHHTLLHDAGRIFDRRPTEKVTTRHDRQDGETHIGTATTKQRTSVMLQVVPLTMHGPAGSKQTHALLDLGSQISLVTDRIAGSVGLTGPAERLCVSTVNGRQNIQSRRVDFQIQPLTSDKKHDVSGAQTTPTLNASGKKINWPKEQLTWPHLADLPLTAVTNERLDVLLGADLFQLIVPREVREGPAGTPGAVRTNLGWIATSHDPRSSIHGTNVQRVNCIGSSDNNLHEQVKQLWFTESFGTKYNESPRKSKADERALALLSERTTRVGQRYETGLLWKSEDIHLPDSRAAAQKRL